MKYDVILVLAGGIKNDGTLPKNVKPRVEMAKLLFDQKLAPRVLMCGHWSFMRDSIPPKTESEAMVEYGRSIGIPAKAMLQEKESDNTPSNALYALKLFLKPNNWKKVVVVTSDYHMARAKYVLNTLLGPEYTIRYEGAKTQVNVFKRLQWWARESLVLLMTIRYFSAFSKKELHNLHSLKTIVEDFSTRRSPAQWFF